MTSPNNTALVAEQPTVFTYLGQKAASGPIFGGVLVGDYVNNSTTTPAGSSYNVPTVTLSGGVPVSAQLELQSTTGALLVMRMTTTQRNALITVVNGMMIYNTTTTTFQFYQNGAWVSLSAGAGGVTGPGGGSTDTAIATWNGSGGTALNNSTVLLDGSGNITQVLSISNAIGTAAAPSYLFFGRTDVGMYSSAAHLLDFATAGTRQLEIGGNIVAVNYATIKGSTTGNPVVFGATGSDSAVSIQLFPKGTTTGQVIHPLGAVATPAITFLGELDTGLYSSAAATIDFASTGGRNLSVLDSGGTTVNYATIKGSATGNAVVIGTTGTDGTVNLQLFPKGTTTGQVVFPLGAVATPSITFLAETDTGFYSSAAATIDAATTGGRQFQVANVASAVNWISVTGGATVAAGAGPGQPVFKANGTDTLVDVAVKSKGAATGLSVLPNSAAGAGLIKLWNGGGTFYTALQSANVGSNLTWTWATVDALYANAPLVSNASGVLSFNNAGFMSITGTLTAANLAAMYATPISVISASASSTIIVIHRIEFEYLKVTTAYDANGGSIFLTYGSSAHAAAGLATAGIALTGLTDQTVSTASTAAGAMVGLASSAITATAIFISNTSGALATGDGTAKYTIWYSVVAA